MASFSSYASDQHKRTSTSYDCHSVCLIGGPLQLPSRSIKVPTPHSRIDCNIGNGIFIAISSRARCTTRSMAKMHQINRPQFSRFETMAFPLIDCPVWYSLVSYWVNFLCNYPAIRNRFFISFFSFASSSVLLWLWLGLDRRLCALIWCAVAFFFFCSFRNFSVPMKENENKSECVMDVNQIRVRVDYESLTESKMAIQC